ncbi:Heat-labile enterotoxin, A chain [Cordyceps fumosorosea ARSEF 2679]|uniref:Heat-labile enterotoxin, A chain n=1 Tax=Cordyceps fumosorosea (strain ARSEF 2679) TaxID=1081104 RepID=A0A162N218_CORFA|nr:Heat-labile enterotoxin, A chain [Cordyceps fumosorosea ARSEF 2679]OAA74229.1 Heat-labile enterotoxin, A chain [Cordyceps fumosorosea ARSEF 2679]
MINPLQWTTAALAFAAASVHAAALPACQRQARPLPTVLYRGGANTPESVKENGGFIPRFRDDPNESITNNTFGLRSHHLGQNRTLYTSTTRDIVMGATYAMQEDAHGWVYKIHPTPNMIDLNDSGFKITFPREEEFSALGGIRYDQIEGWAEIDYKSLEAAGMSKYDIDQLIEIYPIKGEMAVLNFTANPDFAAKKYEGLLPSPGQPQLSGDEANLKKYNEKTLEEYAIEFMKKNGGPVGWDGEFPLSSLKKDAAPQPTTAREREDKLCFNSDKEFGMTTGECRAQVAQCVFEQKGKEVEWSVITDCMKVKWLLV